jgi:glutathionylspermidine synthase
MISKKYISKLPNEIFKALGWDYFIAPDTQDYLVSELVRVTEKESDAYCEAANTLYELFIKAGEYVLEKNLLDTLAIPKNMHQLIRHTWEDDRNLHLFGRFDFSGGLFGEPIKLLEFNADTATSLPETSIIQWAQLKANDLDETAQFNFVYEALVQNFRRLRELNPDLEPNLLFSTLPDAPEDEHNVQLLSEAATEAGFTTAFAYISEVVFSENEGVLLENKAQTNTFTRYDFWFKLIPWEYIALDEPELMDLLTKIVQRRHAVVINPAYTLIFQSKGLLKYLWDLFPNHPLLLNTTFHAPTVTENRAYVQKVMFGREGANVAIFDKIGLPQEVNTGDYGQYPLVYQDFVRLQYDNQGQFYQAGVFFAYEACGLGFRRNKSRIIDNGAQFVGHIVE